MPQFVMRDLVGNYECSHLDRPAKLKQISRQKNMIAIGGKCAVFGAMQNPDPIMRYVWKSRLQDAKRFIGAMDTPVITFNALIAGNAGNGITKCLEILHRSYLGVQNEQFKFVILDLPGTENGLEDWLSGQNRLCSAWPPSRVLGWKV